MRPVFAFPILIFLAGCDAGDSPKKPSSQGRPEPAAASPVEEVAAEDVPAEEKPAIPADVRASVVRVNSTQQAWNVWQPWEKTPPRRRRALAAIVGPGLVVTTAELVADATYLEFESPDGTRFAPAKVIAADYEANLALLGPKSAKEGAALFEGTVPFEISSPTEIGSTMEILQIEDNGRPLLTSGILQSVDLTSSLIAGHSFLTYMVKASMQSAAGSYSLPVLRDDKLAGVLVSYNSKDQLCDVHSTEILARFVAEAADGEYAGFPGLGVSIARTEDASFRKWLKLGDDQGGLYIQKVRPGGAAEVAGVKPGDVLLAVDGMEIDRRGYFSHPLYGNLSWGHLIRGEKSTGDEVVLSMLRAGEPIEIKAVLSREEEQTKLVPGHTFDQAPSYLVKGGLVFQELTLPVLEGIGEDWQTRAPLNLLDAYENPEKFDQSVKRVVFLSGVIPTPATVGYERLRNLIIDKVNDKPVLDIKSLIQAFESHSGEIHTIRFADENLAVNLDELLSSEVDSQLVQRGITRLSRTN